VKANPSKGQVGVGSQNTENKKEKRRGGLEQKGEEKGMSPGGAVRKMNVLFSCREADSGVSGGGSMEKGDSNTANGVPRGAMSEDI